MWSAMTELHYRIRRRNLAWPSDSRWMKWSKGGKKGPFPALSTASVQQLCRLFNQAVNSARQLRKKGYANARYPHRPSRYRDVPYTNGAAKIKTDRQGRSVLRLPNGTSGELIIRLPHELPGRFIKATLRYGEVLVCCEVPDGPTDARTTIGVDLGVNTLMAATDGERAVLVSGREAKATVQWRNKCLAQINQRQSSLVKRSRVWRRLQRRKMQMLEKARRRVLDHTHKATRIIADAFPDAHVIVGKPFNGACRKMGRKWAQQVSQACNRRLIEQLRYKMVSVSEVNEAYSSQTCPVCGVRNKRRRIYTCSCGHTAPRDVVGATNILAIGREGEMSVGRVSPARVEFLRPGSKYSGHEPDSSGGYPASCSAVEVATPRRWHQLDFGFVAVENPALQGQHEGRLP